jgi:hypothetical protein
MLVACSSNNDSGVLGKVNPFTALYNAIGNALPGGVSSSSFSATSSGMSDIGIFAFPGDFTNSIWPDINAGNVPLNKSGAQYLNSLVSSSSIMSARGNFTNGLMIACFLDLYAAKGNDGKLSLGPGQTMTILPSWAQSGCPGASNLNPTLFNQSITYTVTDPGGGVYDRKVEMLNANSPFNYDQWIYFKVNNGVVTFAHDEQNNNNWRAVNFAYYDPNAQVVRAQYITNRPSLKNIYRLYSEGPSDKFALLAHHEFSGNDTWVVLTGKSSNLNVVTVAANYNLSVSANNQKGCFNFTNNLLDGSGTNFNNCNGIASPIDTTGIGINPNIPNTGTLANNFSPNFTASNDIKTASTQIP